MSVIQTFVDVSLLILSGKILDSNTGLKKYIMDHHSWKRRWNWADIAKKNYLVGVLETGYAKILTMYVVNNGIDQGFLFFPRNLFDMYFNLIEFIRYPGEGRCS